MGLLPLLRERMKETSSRLHTAPTAYRERSRTWRNIAITLILTLDRCSPKRNYQILQSAYETTLVQKENGITELSDDYCQLDYFPIF
jgi:hypothetical protein